MGYDVVVVGAGFAGSVVAERLARAHRKRVLVLERRDHIGGNAYDHRDAAGILVHRYGPHIFHTNSDRVFAYLSEFTAWHHYEHRVLSHVRGRLVPFPINRTTINALFGLRLADDEAAAAFYDSRAMSSATGPQSLKDVICQTVGPELYQLFFEGYSRKQWGMGPDKLEPSLLARVPARTTEDDRYFLDRHQGIPCEGYTRLFERLLEHPSIEVRTGVDFASARDQLDYRQLVYTGPIDEFFGWRYGPLPYRSIRFEFETLPTRQHQPVATINYPDAEVAFTRVTEFKHMTGQSHDATTIVREFPQSVGDPYYPVPHRLNRALYERYVTLARDAPKVYFVGRLATYRYLDMDQVVAQALKAASAIAAPGNPSLDSPWGT